MAGTLLHERDEQDENICKKVRFSSFTNANDAIALIIVSDPKQFQLLNEYEFSPAFTYHAFGTNEEIEGYKGLKISIAFNAYDFSAFLDVHYKEKESVSDDIRVKLKGSLPDDTIENKEEFLKKLEQQRKTFSPPGKLVHSYKRLVDKVEKHFEIYACSLEDNKKASELHTKMQKMALWFIEGADGIDVNDPRWIIYIVYERTSLQSEQKNHPKDFSPVGFVTLFKFCNPVGRKGNCRPEQIETHRLCQALIYPSYQRQGHGEQVVKFVFEEAVKNDSVYEITVEDPVPAFSRLRDIVDVENCIKLGFFSLPPKDTSDKKAYQTTTLTSEDIQAVQEKLKITQKQVQRCYEILKLRFIDRTNEEEYKKYRLEVKKRLYKLNLEEMEGMGPDRRKALLETEYQELEANYQTILKHFTSKPNAKE